MSERERFFAAIRRVNDRLAGITRRGPTRFPGIVRDAAALGVDRVTLYRTLTGKWNLPGLRSRYEAMKKEAR